MTAAARRVRYADAAEAVASACADTWRVLRYRRYWRKVTPRTDRARFNRWLFAFASVQTGWARNVAVYKALAAPGARYDRASLRELFGSCGAGMVTVRTEGVARFHEAFWADPGRFRPAPGEPFPDCRDRLASGVHGLGVAKVAFALELCHPEECDAVCLDRHLLKLYGVDPERATDRHYRRAEAHWRRECARLGVPCPVARHIYWDGVQGKRSTRYWSHVFENEEAPCTASAAMSV